MRLTRFLTFAAISAAALVGCGKAPKPVAITGITENEVAREYIQTVSYPDGNYEETSIPGFDTLKTAFRKDQPSPLEISWENDGTFSGVILRVAEDKKMSKIFLCNELKPEEKSAEVFNLIPGKEYWFKVTGERDGKERILARGTLKAEGALRMIRTDALHNVRDIGGWKTTDGKTIKYGLIFRGGQMNRQDPPSAEDQILMKEALGIKADVDLRWDNELDGGTPDDPSDDLYYTPLGEGVEYVHMPVNLYDPGHADKTQWNNLLNYVMDNVIAGRPCYIHCAAGADRTGTTCFLLEGVLGLSEQSLSKEYELTSFSTYGRRGRDNPVAYKYMMSYILAQEGDTIRDKIENYFTEYVGISKEKIEAFRAAMLE